jgi:dynein heavy chain
VLFIGSAGTGKTALVKNFLATTNPDKVKYTTINFSSFTDSMSL